MLREMQPPSSIDINCPGFSLSQFYDLKMKLDKEPPQTVESYNNKIVPEYSSASIDTLDLDSNDLSTDGMNQQIEHRQKLSELSTDPLVAIKRITLDQEDGYESQEMTKSQIRDELMQGIIMDGNDKPSNLSQ